MNTIVRQLHSEVYRLRKIIFILLLSLGFTVVFAERVNWNYSIETGLNLANQLCYNPMNIANETYHWKTLKAPVALAAIEYQRSKHLSLVGKVGYDQKGFVQVTQNHSNDGSLVNPEAQSATDTRYAFHYASLQGHVKYTFGRSILQPFVNGGLAMNLLMSKPNFDAPMFQHYNTALYNYHHYNSVSIGAIAGLGLLFDERFGICVDTNFDITRSVNTVQLHVNNWVNSIKIIVALNPFFE